MATDNVAEFTTSLVPAAQVYPGYASMGPVYEMASYGDILRMWITPDFTNPFALTPDRASAPNQVRAL